MQFSELWDKIADYFLTTTCLARVQVMTKAASQIEGWWKAEMMLLMEHLREDDTLQSWDRECSVGSQRGKVDFRVGLGPETGVIELKTALCCLQKGTLWKLQSYVMGPKNGYILTDILKLGAIMRTREVSRCFLLVFAHPAPPREDWQTLIRTVSSKAFMTSVTLARLNEAPAGELSIGWLEVT